MVDRLTPAMRVEVLELIWNYRNTSANTLVQYIAELRDEAARREAEADAPPPTAPFVTDHKWLDPECHASGCQTLILKAELEKLRDQRDKYMWQVRDTCARAEAAEAELRIHRERAASLNNMWRHEFSREVEAAADKLFARMAWPHKEIRALAGGNDG